MVFVHHCSMFLELVRLGVRMSTRNLLMVECVNAA